MNLKTTALCIALVPGLAMLAACKHDNDSDDMAPAAAASSDAVPADATMAADGAASDSIASARTASDSTASDSTASDSMYADTSAGDAMSFADMDKNHDGGISKDELAPTDMLYEHFAVADADGNGMLSEAEVAKHRADMAAVPAK